MKSKKMLVPVAVLLLTVISLFSLIDTNKKNIEEYNNILATARDYASQGIVDDAVKYYEKAIELNCLEETYVEYMNVYLENGYEKKALSVAEAMVSALPKSEKAYDCLLDRYIALNSLEDCFSLDDEVTKKKIKSEYFAEKMAEIEYAFETEFQTYSSVNVFSGGYATVETEGLYGVVDETGSGVLSRAYKEAGCFSYFTNEKNADDSGYVLPVCTKDGKWMYISPTGNKKIEISGDLTFDRLGLYVDKGLTACSVGGKYAYYNSAFEKQFGDYAYAGTFNCGRAAVKVNENEWYIINEKGEKLNETPYIDVALDGKEIAFRNDRAFVMIGSDYYMIDTDCNTVGKNKFTDVRPYNENLETSPDSYAAALIDGKWGFVDKDNNIVIKPQFVDAHSFSNKFAAVKKDGKWGFINKEGTVVIDYRFEDAGDFSSKGCAFVSTDSNWSMIKLYRYNH